MGAATKKTDSTEIVAERLERLRLKLLDLSTNNRMLSFRHPKTSCLRIVDELPEQLFQALLDGQALTFEPVLVPSPRELDVYYRQTAGEVPRHAAAPAETRRPEALAWAKRLGISTDYELPIETDPHEREERHSDRKIQTLHYPDDLDARLRKIRSAGRMAIEESGAKVTPIFSHHLRSYGRSGVTRYQDALASTEPHAASPASVLSSTHFVTTLWECSIA